RDLLAVLLMQLDPPPSDLVHLLRGGSAGAGSTADEALLLKASGHRIAALVPPVVVVVDDAELLDDAEAAALAGVAATSDRPWLFASRRRLDTVPLPVVEVPALAPEEARRLLDTHLPGATPELCVTVLDRAGNSPMFLEQCARLLLENGALTFVDGAVRVQAPERISEIPRSMRTFVSDRLDLLPSQESIVLGLAAVLGAQLELGLLQFLAGDHAGVVDRLVERGLLRRATDDLGQECLRFSHALVRDAAYERVELTDRVATHRAAAEWYAVLPVSQVLESQAFHLEAAARLQAPDCDLLRRTVDAMVLFARSIEEERTRVAQQVLTRARALVDSRPECSPDVLELHLALASVSFTLGLEEEAATAATAALSMAEERGDTRAAAEAHLHLGRVVIDADPQRSLAELERAGDAYAEVGDPGGEARVEVVRGFVRQHDEGIAQQLSGLERSYNLAMRSADTRLQASCAQQLAMHHAFTTGRQAFELWAQRARDMSRRDDLGLEPRLDVAAAALAMYGLDVAQGREAAAQALAAGRDLGLRDVYTNALISDLDLAVAAGMLDDARALLAEARAFAETRPSSWWDLQYDLVEARLLLRAGDPAGGQRLLDRVAAHELAGNRVLQKDLAEARAWMALERGRFGEARALAAEAVAIDLETGERVPQLRPRLVELVATVAAGENLALSTIADLRALSRDSGLGTIAQLATRWLFVDELTRAWSVDLHALQPCELIECRALDLEIEALSSRTWPLLLAAADVWAGLGTTIWHARALLWHSELTGSPSPEADDLLAALESPEGLGEQLRAQVRGLRA
ncbi:MAG TPA: hypothetical protein VM097_06880, partial [Mycobacteriales bacterium]|nr:hypothetical protein [Mycobacteriales bacterium]